MGQGMASQVTVTTEHFTAGIALIGFVICMRQEMRFQIGPLVEAATTDRTFVRRLLKVEDLVYCQGSGLTEAFATLSALEWFLLRMDVPGTDNNFKNY